VPRPSRRKIGTMEVVSLFAYDEIRDFILTKHTPIGYRVYRYFAKKHIGDFLESCSDIIKGDRAYIVGVDEYVKGGYSHIAVLSRYGASGAFKPLNAKLIARNRVDYAGKTIEFRIENPRDFEYTGPSGIDVVLLDDIVTTGLTLQEAGSVVRGHGVNVLFALTLADASR